MKFKREHFCCSPRLLSNIPEISEIEAAIANVAWTGQFRLEADDKSYEHQTGYNRALAGELHKRGWTLQPRLCENPRLIGDACKNDVFVEVQFGNSCTLYRDYYKFHYGLQHGLLSLAVLIVPTNPLQFFPTRPRSVANMAEFDLAYRYFKV
ncbi:MAG TPA: BglII/BstYI family type II restriction endonuclease, partial [Candidatus Solibacter sp.]|nr:BglII/BstYI family type II restriction endonuclease [Candidatus Solibacter sp.]